MKAIVHDRYGSPDDLELREVDTPTVGADGVLVRARAASVNAGDWRLLRGEPYVFRFMMGLRRPKRSVLGGEVAGHVEAVGEKVTQFEPGDGVFGACGAAFAEYVCGTVRNFVPEPASLTSRRAGHARAKTVVTV